jgi:hypothetical protein
MFLSQSMQWKILHLCYVLSSLAIIKQGSQVLRLSKNLSFMSWIYYRSPLYRNVWFLCFGSTLVAQKSDQKSNITQRRKNLTFS